MSSLLAGPNRLTEWIENSAFDAIVKGPESVEYRPKLVQVLSRGGRGWSASNTAADSCCPPYLIIHDGRISTAAFLSHKAQQELGMPEDRAANKATKGCIVRISGWTISTVKACAETEDHFSRLTRPPPNTTRFSCLNRLISAPLCLVVEGVETLGGQGMGIVGNAVDVNESVEVRRALQFIQHDYNTLCKRLKLQDTVRLEDIPVGDVTKLGTSDFDLVLQQIDDPQKEQEAVPVGNVQELFNAANRNDSVQDNPLDELFGLAEQQSATHGQASVARTADSHQTQDGNIGSVSQLLEHDHQAVGNKFDAILALAEQQRQAEASANNETQQPDLEENTQDETRDDGDSSTSKGFLGRLSDIFATAARKMSPSQIKRTEATQERNTTEAMEMSGQESESEEIVGISEMLASQPDQIQQDENDAPMEAEKEKAVEKKLKRWVVDDRRPLKKHKASSEFFAELRRLGREEGDMTFSPGTVTDTVTGDIRSWLDCHVKA